MSSVSPEESPVYNCSSLLTTSRDADSECVRLGPAGWWGSGGVLSSERSNGERRYCGREWAYTDVLRFTGGHVFVLKGHQFSHLNHSSNG